MTLGQSTLGRMSITDEKYVSLTTFKRNGERRAVPVWIVDFDGKAGFTTGADSWKLKRLRNDPRCELQPCNGRGAVNEGAIVVTGTGREASPEEFAQIKSAVAKKYGLMGKAIGLIGKISSLRDKSKQTANTAVVVTLD